VGQAPAQEAVASALADAAVAFTDAGIRYVLIGGLASTAHGRPRATADIDFLVHPDDALSALAALDAHGFETEETNPHWIYKAARDGVTVDLIFKVSGDIYLDEEMSERATIKDVYGRGVRVASPEDMLVIKAIAHDEPSFRHWHDALAIVAESSLDWDYVCRRARHGARRVLSLLVYAQSNDLIVPEEPLRALFQTIYDGKPPA
jgi:predicted nucleotidyltransferase